MFKKKILIGRSVFSLLGCAAISMSAMISQLRADDLSEALEYAGWTGILGTWVDEDSKGNRVKITYAWKFEGKLIEVTSKMGDTQSVSLMGFNPETEEVYMVGGNSKGGGSLGKWRMEGADVVLELGYMSPTGDKGGMSLRHHRVDDDTIVVSGNGENGNPFTLRLVRAQ